METMASRIIRDPLHGLTCVYFYAGEPLRGPLNFQDMQWVGHVNLVTRDVVLVYSVKDPMHVLGRQYSLEDRGRLDLVPGQFLVYNPLHGTLSIYDQYEMDSLVSTNKIERIDED